MKAVIDFERAEAVITRLLLTYRARALHFKNALLPQRYANLPREFTRATDSGLLHSLFLFHANYYMQGGIDSEYAFRAFQYVAEKYPELFIPAYARHVRPEHLAAILTEAGLGFQKKVARWWIQNAAVLDDYWDGDPRNLFFDLPDDERALFQELLRRMAYKPGQSYPAFIGFQKKITPMATYFVEEANIVKINGPYPSPADFHLLRDFTVTESIRLEGVSATNGGQVYLSARAMNEALDAVREITLWYCLKHGVSHLELAEALWFHSNLLCSKAPGNEARIVGGRNGRKTDVRMSEVTWTPSQVKAYQQTCSGCVIARYCKFNMPSSPYYVLGTGVLVPRPKWGHAQLLTVADFDPTGLASVERCVKHRNLWNGNDHVCIGCGECEYRAKTPHFARAHGGKQEPLPGLELMTGSQFKLFD